MLKIKFGLKFMFGGGSRILLRKSAHKNIFDFVEEKVVFISSSKYILCREFHSASEFQPFTAHDSEFDLSTKEGIDLYLDKKYSELFNRIIESKLSTQDTTVAQNELISRREEELKDLMFSLPTFLSVKTRDTNKLLIAKFNPLFKAISESTELSPEEKATKTIKLQNQFQDEKHNLFDLIKKEERRLNSNVATKSEPFFDLSTQEGIKFHLAHKYTKPLGLILRSVTLSVEEKATAKAESHFKSETERKALFQVLLDRDRAASANRKILVNRKFDPLFQALHESTNMSEMKRNNLLKALNYELLTEKNRLFNEQKINQGHIALLLANEHSFEHHNILHTLRDILKYTPEVLSFDTMDPFIRTRILHAFETKDSAGNVHLTSGAGDVKMRFSKMLTLLHKLHIPWKAIKHNIFEELIQNNAKHMQSNQMSGLLCILSGMDVNWSDLQPATVVAIKDHFLKCGNELRLSQIVSCVSALPVLGRTLVPNTTTAITATTVGDVLTDNLNTFWSLNERLCVLLKEKASLDREITTTRVIPWSTILLQDNAYHALAKTGSYFEFIQSHPEGQRIVKSVFGVDCVQCK